MEGSRRAGGGADIVNEALCCLFCLFVCGEMGKAEMGGFGWAKVFFFLFPLFLFSLVAGGFGI